MSPRITPDFNRTATIHQGEQVTDTEHTVNTSATNGRFALLVNLLRAKGSGALSPRRSPHAAPAEQAHLPAVVGPRRRAGLALASLIAFAAFLSPAAAQAAPPALIPDGQFKAPENAVGVAVDNSGGPSSGDVYVANFWSFIGEDIHQGRVNKFDPAGNPLSPPSPFGEAFTYSAGAVINPTNGDLYALGEGLGGPTMIETFDPNTGELVPSSPPFPVQPSANFEFLLPWTVVGIATDSGGNVYVPVVPENEVLEYSPAGALLETFTGGSGSGALKEPTAVAVDPAGNLWVADTGNGRIEQLSSADTPVSEIPVEGTLQSVAVDAHTHVFVTLRNSADLCGSLEPPCPHLLEYSSAGAQLADLGAGEFGGGTNNGGDRLPNMVAVNDTTGRVYVTDPFNSRVFIYASPTPPKVENELAVGVTTSEAKLGALLNPGGIGTSYRFEYGTTTAYGHSSPFPEGDAGTGLHSHTVWAGPSGLQPGTTYHYRVVVANELGQVEGEDKTFTTETAVQAACPNDQFRTGFSAALPDCRAYELLTPPNKFSAQPDKDLGGNGPGELNVQETLANNSAASDGNRFEFRAEDVLPGSPSASENYLTTRGSGGWSSENLIPPTNYYGFQCQTGLPGAPRIKTLSDDFSKAILSAESGGQCGLEPELVSGEPHGTENLFLRDNTTGAYQLIDLTPSGVTATTPEFVGASTDLSHILFREVAPLTPNALSGVVNNLYEWNAGRLRLVSLLPDETAVETGFAAISADGSRVFFKAGGDLYARVNGTETVQLDASQAGGPGGGGTFVKAGPDGSQVIFSDDASAALTPDTEPGSGTNLYLYDFTAPVGQRLTDLTPAADTGAPTLAGLSADGSQVIFTDDASAALTPDTVPGSGTNIYRYKGGQLTDLTPVAHAEVQQMIGISEDGSSVYFKAAGVLTGAANQHGELAQSGQPNLYLSRGGATAFIVTNPAEGSSQGRLKVSANGAFLAFESIRSLTGYDNINPDTGQPAVEIYFYDAATSSLDCASCNPSGEPPTADGPGVTSHGSSTGAFEERAPHNLSENGQVFFDSSEALLPSDTNRAGGCSLASGVPACTDVFEFEPDGVGTCADVAGCVFLISTGTGSLETFFIDASPSGNDVFIREFQKLVPGDTQDDAPSLYDVRVGGGFPELASPPACTTADACRPAPQPQPSIAGAPATATLSGPGNVKPVHKHHKRHHAKHKRHAGANRGGHK